MNISYIAFAILALISSNMAFAEQRAAHYEGKQAATLDAAFENLSETNARIVELMADASLEPVELSELHQLTYTAENALAKITEELDALKEALEFVHKASEKYDGSTAMEQTPVYLEKSQQLFGR